MSTHISRSALVICPKIAYNYVQCAIKKQEPYVERLHNLYVQRAEFLASKGRHDDAAKYYFRAARNSPTNETAGFDNNVLKQCALEAKTCLKRCEKTIGKNAIRLALSQSACLCSDLASEYDRIRMIDIAVDLRITSASLLEDAEIFGAAAGQYEKIAIYKHNQAVAATNSKQFELAKAFYLQSALFFAKTCEHYITMSEKNGIDFDYLRAAKKANVSSIFAYIHSGSFDMAVARKARGIEVFQAVKARFLKENNMDEDELEHQTHMEERFNMLTQLY